MEKYNRIIRLFTLVICLLVIHTTWAQTNLTWDPGTTQFGTEAYTNPVTDAGSYLFEITTTNTAGNVGYWRTVLTVTSGEADLYISTSPSVSPISNINKSDTTGNDRITTSLTAGQTWYLLVEAEAGAEWSIFAGDMHVQDLTWDHGTSQSGTEVITNPGTQEGSYLFRVVTESTTNDVGMWRTVLNCTSGNADLYIDPDPNVATNNYQYYSNDAGSDTIVQTLSAGQTRYILVEAEEGAAWSIFAGDIFMTELTWDPGTADAGTEVFTNLNTDGGAYYFKITTEPADLAAWRTALDVIGGEANVYLRQNNLPLINSSGMWRDDESTYSGDDGMTRYLSELYGAGQEWYILVQADTGSTWNLLSGDVYAEDLGTLATNATSSSGLAEVPPEGIRYFKTSIPAEALAWRLWLKDSTDTTTLSDPFYIKHGLAPHPSSTSYYDRTRTGQGLLVPDYVVPGSPTSYYVGVPGEPGDQFQLDSRQQEITDAAYNDTLLGESASGYLFKTYRIAVPPEQIAWEVTVEPTGGTNPDMAVRRTKVPNPFNNDAFSEVNSETTSDSTTLVPETLSDGTFYVTVYGSAAFSFNMRNREPIITQIDFNSSTLNNDPNRAGWHFFAVSDIGQQLGQLGWLLELTNHVVGTEIAIRRNYVPGRWNYRQNGYTTVYNTAHNDQSSTLGFLQDPDHEADVWYVGIYYPDAALGAFTLISGSHTPIEIPMDAFTNSTVSLEPNSWHFYHVDVPAQTNGEDVVGWELRMTSWSSERPYMAIRRDQLPEGTSTINAFGNGWYYPRSSSTWPSGYQWVNRNSDWSGYYYDPGGQIYPQPILSMGMGAPLEPGSYYVGFYNNSSTVTGNYSFTSSAIGTNMAYETPAIAFNGGSAPITNLSPRGVAYFKVNIPTNTPSWEVELENTDGESQLFIREAYVQTWDMGQNDTHSPGANFSYMVRLNKTGDEHYVLLPESGTTNIPPGDYYLMVVGEGVSPSGSTIGTGTSSAMLYSHGEATVTDLGTVPLAPATISQPDSYGAGEIDLFQFDVPSGLEAIEVELTDRVGNPVMDLRTDTLFPYGPQYGIYSGYNNNYTDPRLITIANPAAGTYSLTIGCPDSTPVAGSYTLTIRAITSSGIVFDGGGDTAVTIPPRSWKFYHVDVPAQTNGQDVIGWELRTTAWSGERPYMAARRDLLPAGTGTWYYPRSSTSWASGNQWTTRNNDWSWYNSNPTGTQTYPQYLLSMGMNRPLTPGSYYIGFYNNSSTVTGTFSFASSAIGVGMTYEPQTLGFASDSVTITNLPARGVEYVQVEVPAGQPSWKVRLENTSGETSLYMRKAYVPTWTMSTSSIYSPDSSISYMTELKKEGDEYFVMLPENGQTTIAAGTYYLMVVSAGQNPSGSNIGTGTASAVLHSLGNAPVFDLGTLPGAGEKTKADSYESGEVKLYEFDVPIGVLAMQVRLDDRIGNPEINLRIEDTNFPYGASYGSYSGYNPTHAHNSLITIANPTPGHYTLMVNDVNGAYSTPNGSYTLRIVTQGTTDIVFGSDSNVVLPPGLWAYYKIEVPAQTNGQDVIGWELRTSEWSGERPYMATRRDQLPSGTGTWYYPRRSTNWASGNQWTTRAGDWSHYYNNWDGSQSYPKYLISMGMNRPLSVGTYYIGFYNNSSTVTSTFTFASSAIGNGMTYDPQPIDFNGGTGAVVNLPARDVMYFEVDVPTNTANWKIKLENTVGETGLYVREGYVPTWSMYQNPTYSPGEHISYMAKLQKTDDEHYLLLPENGTTTIPSGRYYLMVVSEGQNPSGSNIGTNSSSALLISMGEGSVVNMGGVPLGGSVDYTNSYEAGEANLYRFNVQSNSLAIVMKLEGASGDPRMHLRTDANMPNGLSYGLYSGYADSYYNESVITIPNPTPGTWSMMVGDPDSYTTLNNSSYRLVIEEAPPPDLNFDTVLNTNGNSNVVSGLLEDDERDYYRVDVPETVDGNPVIGWYLTTSVASGDAQIRVRKDLLPSDSGGGYSQTPFKSTAIVIVPTLLTSGTWYVEVKGVGATDYELTSSAVRPERSWTMPALGEPITTPGLSAPLFGDSGVDIGGTPLPVDQSVDLNNSFYHVYEVTVPDSNAGLLKTQLEAISGNPNLYVRSGNVPTLDHDTNGSGYLYDHSLTSTENTEYGNWVPYDGRYEYQLTPGTWYIMVKADGGSNARYRLKLAGGNAYTGGNVQDLDLETGSETGQLLADNDWRHYRVVIPTNAPVNWNITYSQASGNVDFYIRDTVPAGNDDRFSDTHGSYLRDWHYDYKNTGTPRSHYENTGTHTINMPPLRPGHVYYLSFIAKSDANFSVSSSTSGGTIPTYEMVGFETGYVVTNVPAGATITYQVDCPTDAVRWIHTVTNSDNNVYLEQGTLPSQTTSDHWYRLGSGGSVNQYLLDPDSNWPWRPGYTYYFTVHNPTASPAQFILDMSGSTAAEIPQNLTATDGTYTDRVYVSWNSISGAGGYEVWRNTIDDKTSATNIASPTYRSYNDYAAVPGQLYYYWASVEDATNIAWFSSSDGGWVPGSGSISPSNRTHHAGAGSDTIDVTVPADTLWNATESIYWIDIDSGTPGTNNGTVAYSIDAYAGSTARTGTITVAQQTFTVIQEAFGVPANVSATDGAFEDRTEATWDNLPGATRYYLYRNTTNDTSSATYLGYVNATNFYSDIGGILNRTYFYWVRPYNSGGTGDYSLPDTGCRGFGGATPAWIALYFPGGYPGDLADSDGDGFTNHEEFISGTVPTDPLSFFEISSIGSSPAGYAIHWTSVSGRVYGIDWTDDLANPFVSQTNGIPYPENSWTDTVHSATGEGFYKLDVEIP